MSRSRREGGAVHRRRFCVSVSVWFPTVTVTHSLGRKKPLTWLHASAW